jgi:hypothetical protein
MAKNRFAETALIPGPFPSAPSGFQIQNREVPVGPASIAIELAKAMLSGGISESTFPAMKPVAATASEIAEDLWAEFEERGWLVFKPRASRKKVAEPAASMPPQLHRIIRP